MSGDLHQAPLAAHDYSPEVLEQLVLAREAMLPVASSGDATIASAAGPAVPFGAPFADLPHPSEAGDEPEADDVYRLTELGNAERFADLCVGSLRHVHAWKAWLAWDGKRWRSDASGAESEAAKNVVEQLFERAGAAQRQAAQLTGEHADVLARASSSDRSTEGKRAREQARSSPEFTRIKEAQTDAAALIHWATLSSTAKVIGNTVKLARSDPRLVATPADFDRDRWTINLENGTLDLRTGELRPHRQADMITRLANASYDPDAPAPRWEQFLEQIQPDPEMRVWLQRFMGYCLTGEVSEQVMLFALGTGNNGKNVLFDTVLAILGDYAMVAAPDLLVLKHNDEHPTAFADLQGRRLVVVSEIDHGRRWAEAAIKRLTGDATIKARRMHQDFYEFPATFKFTVMANTKPDVRGTDNGIWRRILLAPFDVTIAEKDRDRGLPRKLLEERDGILAWAVRGCTAWRREGLGTVPAIANAVAEYRREQDVAGEWISERCVCVCLPNAADPPCWRDDGFCATCGAVAQPRLVADGAPREPWSALYPDFKGWLEARGLRPWSMPAFRGELVKRRWLRPYRTSTERGIEGIRLRYQAPEGWPTRSDRYTDRER